MKIRCPKCNLKLREKDVDIAKDSALCRRCHLKHNYGELMAIQKELPGNLQHPPEGSWFKRLPDGFEVGAKTRSFSAFYLVPMSFLVLFACWRVLTDLPNQTTGSLTGHSTGFAMLLGAVLLNCSMAAMAVAGRLMIRVSGGQGVLFRGVGSWGWRRRFDWAAVTSIQMDDSYNEGYTEYIVIEGSKRLRLASNLKRERRVFMLAALQLMHRSRSG